MMSPPPMWENQIEFLAPGFRLTPPSLVQTFRELPSMMRDLCFFHPLSVSDLSSTFEINKNNF